MRKAGLSRAAASSGRVPRGIACLLVACAAGCGQPGAGDGTTLLFASGADLQSINPLLTVHPLAKQVQKHVLLLTLAAYDDALRPIPRLAAWEWNADRTALRFQLRRDIRWHDGVPTTSDDAMWTLARARDPAVAYPRARDLEAVTSITRIDSFAVEVRFRSPRPAFPDVFTDLAILPAHRFRGLEGSALRDAPFNEAPIGNGPFAFVEHRPNQRWVFRRAPGFPEALGRPGLDRFVLVIVDEPTTKLAALTSGEIHFAGINPAHAAFARADRRLRVIDYPVQLAYGLVFNLRRAPFDDPRVRRAMASAIDRHVIVDAYLYGFGAVAVGPVAPDHPWFEPVQETPFDTELAGRLLDSAGWVAGSDGMRSRGAVPLSFELLTVGSGDLALEQMLQAQLRTVGVAVQLRQLELASFLARVQGGERAFDALVTGIPGDLSLGYVSAMFDGDGPLAYPGDPDPRLGPAFSAVRRAASPAALEAAWRDVQRLLAQRLATAWIYHARGVQGVSARVRGVRVDLRGELAGIATWTLDPEPVR
ncbi:MAG TPA: peptide ABC transporter substrate-binding protein [Gemmatimonadales bacterium]